MLCAAEIPHDGTAISNLNQSVFNANTVAKEELRAIRAGIVRGTNNVYAHSFGFTQFHAQPWVGILTVARTQHGWSGKWLASCVLPAPTCMPACTGTYECGIHLVWQKVWSQYSLRSSPFACVIRRSHAWWTMTYRFWSLLLCGTNRVGNLCIKFHFTYLIYYATNYCMFSCDISSGCNVCTKSYCRVGLLRYTCWFCLCNLCPPSSLTCGTCMFFKSHDPVVAFLLAEIKALARLLIATPRV